MAWYMPDLPGPPADKPPATAPQLVPPPVPVPFDAADLDDPRTQQGALITNGRHLWEVLDSTEDGNWTAVNQRTGYTIALTPETIGTCWCVYSDRVFDAMAEATAA